MAPPSCTFCSSNVPAVNLYFSSPPKSVKGDGQGQDVCCILEANAFSYVLKTFGMINNGAEEGERQPSFPACPGCVEAFQKIQKHFRIISSTLNKIKQNKATSLPPPVKVESFVKEEPVDLEEFFLNPQIRRQEDPSPSPGEVSVPVPLESCSVTLELEGQQTEEPKSKKPSRSYSCSICNKTFSAPFRLTYHRVEIHGIENEGPSFRCPSCPSLFATEHRLNLHQKKKHGKELPPKPDIYNLQCEICKKVFLRRHLLNHHMKTHNPYFYEKVKCDFCPLRISRQSLQRHMKRVHGQGVRKEMSCYFCQKVFTDASYLKDHMLTHTKEKPYICPNFSTCRKDYTRLLRLKPHLKTCGKIFV